MISKMKISLLILICLKNINICGVYRCKSKSLDANPNGIYIFFVASVFVVCWMCRYQGQNASMMKKTKCDAPKFFRALI
jgi:hypothetical protein